MTVLDLIKLALRGAGVNGVGQNPQAEDLTDCLNLLNMMLSQWQVDRFLVYRTADVSCVSTGATSYTVGTGQQFNTFRPDRIEAAFIRYLTAGNPQPDRMLAVLQSREDYDRIISKGLTGAAAVSDVVFYDPTYPVGTLYPWPVPTSGLYEIHLTVKPSLSAFTVITDTINLPPEYLEAIYTNLAVRIRPAYQLPPDPQLNALARAALTRIMAANAQIASLTMPEALERRGRFNIYIGQYQ
jgi:hypothetical protein